MTLTSGVDTGAAFTGGAGNDTFNATVATLGALDVVDAGAGTDTLNVSETNTITTWGGASLTGFETAKVSTTGDIGSIKVTAGAPVATAVAQVATVTVGVASTSQKYDVTIGGVKYTSAAVSAATTAAAATAIRDVLTAHLGDSVTLGTTSSESGAGTTADPYIRTFTITSKIAGTPLTSLAYAISSTTSTATGTVSSAATTANVISTAMTAVKETQVITLSTNPTAGDVVTVSVGGADYTVASSGATVDTLTADIASLLNSVIGAGSAVAAASGGRLTVTALTAGTPLPMLNVVSAGSTTDALTAGVSNKAAVAAAASAVALAAPTGVTSYTATATGVANVSGAATTDITVSGTAVQTSVGNNVTVTASDSVFVSGAKGAVVVTGGTSSTTLVGAVASDTGGTAADAAGIYVTGGTTVTITGTKDSGAVKVGAAPYAKAAVSSTGYPESNGNSSKTPTGDVSITNVSKTTSTTTGAVTGTYSTGTASVYTNGATTVTVKGAGTTIVTDANTQTLSSASGVTAVAGTSKLATVNLAGLSGNATIKSDAISTISVSDTLSARTVTVSNSGTTGVNAGAINLQVSNVGTGSSARLTLDDSTATSVNVSSAAASAYNLVGTTAINSGSKSWVTLTTPKATTITMTNDKSVDLGDLSAAGLAKLATVSGGSATGAIAATVGATSEQGLSFTSGSGNDSVTIASGASLSANATTAAITAISLGAGNDKLLNGSTSTHTVVGATFNGGDGDDTLAASLLTVGNGAQFTSFEVLGLDLTSGSMDATLMSGATSLSLLAQGGTYTNVKASQGLTIAADVTAGTNTLTFASTVTATTALTDAYTVTMGFADTATAATASANVVDGGELIIAGIETVNLVSGGSGNISNAINLTATGATKLVVTGAIDLDLDFGATDSDDNTTSLYFGTTSSTSTDGLGVTEIDASAMTGKLNINTTDVALSTSLALIVKTGSGNDTITLATKSTVDAGAGDDTITTVAGQSSTLTGGAGKDNFIVTATVAASTSAPKITTIKDFTSGDTITMGDVNVVNLKAVGVANVASAVDLVDAITKALGGGSTGITAIANNAAVYFNYGADTYIVVNDTNAGFGTSDIIVKLTGLVDLTYGGSTGLIGVA